MAKKTRITGDWEKDRKAAQEEEKKKEEQERREREKRINEQAKTVRSTDRVTGDWEHDQAVVRARLAPYSRANLSRQNARQQKTESYMDLTTANEPKARAGIEMYKAKADAQKYAEMNRVGYRNYDQDTVDRSVSGFEAAQRRWQQVYDANKGPAAIDPKTSRQSEIRAQAQKIQRQTDTGTGGKDAQADDNRWAGVTDRLKHLGSMQRNVDTPGAKKNYSEEFHPDQVRKQYREAYEQAFPSGQTAKQTSVTDRYSAAEQKLRTAERDAYYWEQAAKDAAWFGDADRFTRSLPHIVESSRKVQGALTPYRQASDELAGAVREQDEALKQGDLATWYARNLSDDEIRRRLEEEQKPISVTDKDRAENPGMYPDAAFRTMPRQSRFDPTMTAGGEAPGNRFYMTEEEKQLTEQSDRELLQRKADDREVQITALQRALESHHVNDLEDRISWHAGRGELPEMARAGREAMARDASGEGAAGYAPTFEDLANGTVSPEAMAQGNASNALATVTRNLMKCTDQQKDYVYAMYAIDPQSAVELSQKYYDDAMDEYYARFYRWASSDKGWQGGRRAVAALLGTGAKLLSGLDPFGDSGQDLSRTGEAFISGGAASASRNGIFGIEALGGDESPISGAVPFIGRGNAGEAYQLGTSILESAGIAAPAMLAGRYDTAAAKVASLIGTTLMGSSAAADDYRECINLGMSDSQAKWHATAAGVAEAAFEYISLDKLIDPENIRHGLLRMLTQGGIEASEEVCTTIANRISDTVIANFAGTKNAIEREALEYQLHGMSAEEAERKAQNQWLAGLMMDGLGGLFSGIIMGGGSDVLQRGLSRVNSAMDTAAENYGSGNLLALETAGYTDTDTLDALTGYARANGIDAKGLTDAQAKAGVSDQGAVVSVQETQGAETGNSQEAIGNSGRETTDRAEDGTPLIRQPEGLTPSPEGEGFGTETRRTRAVEDAGPYEERNAERDATEAAADNGEKPKLTKRDLRRAGKVRAQIVESLSSQFEGKTAAEQAAAYDSLVETYGSGIEAAASEALYNTARRTMQSAENVPTLEQRHGQDAAAFQSETARNAVERAYRDAQTGIMRATGDTTESSVRSLRDASRRAGDGITLQAEVTDKDGSTRTVDVKGWTKDGTKVVLQDGTQADVDSLQTDAATKDLLEAMKEANLGSYADEAFQTFVTSGAARSLSDGHSWIAGYRAAFGVGEVRGNVTNAVRQAARYGVDMETAAAAYYNGVKATDTVREAAKKDLPSRLEISKKGITGKRGSVLFVSEAVENKVSGDAELQDFAEDVRNFAEFFGVEVTLTESKLGWNEKLGKNVYEGSRGAHQAGRIEIDINSGKNFLGDAANGILQTMGHEMTHFLRFYNEDGFQAVRDFATEQIRNQKGQEYLDELIQRQMDGHEGDERFTRDDAIEEVVAEFCQDMLTNKKALETFAKESPKGFKAFVEWVKNFLAKIREKLARSPAATNELAIYRNLEKKVKDAFGELWAKEVMGSVRVHDAVFAEEQTEPGTETITQHRSILSDDVLEHYGEERPAEGHFTGRVKFQMRESIETTDRLVAWHNMNEDALRSALELGGLAMPSWAIKTADRAHTSYGSISVIAPRALVDPKINRSSMIFGGDAWTPVFPGVDYDVTYESAEKLEDEIKSLVGEETYNQIGGAALDPDNISSELSRSGGALPGHYRNSLLMKYAYLKSIGKDVSLPQTGERLDAFGYFSNEEVEQFVNRLVSGKLSLDRFRKMSTDELMQQEDLKAAMAQIREEHYREKLGNNEAFEKLKSSGFFEKDFTFSKVDAMLRAAELYYQNNGIKQTIDKRAAQEVIDKEINKADFEKWALNKLNSAVVKKGIRNEKDTFTPSGNRRSFDALHYAYNLANIVKAMKAQPKQGRTQFLSGPGSVKGAALKSYNTVEQVRNDRGRLVNSAEEGQAAYDEYNRNLEDILDRMRKNGDRFDAADALIEVFQHAKTESGIYNYMQRELKDWYNISRELAHDAYELIGQINRLPMEYFEGKTYDAVRFDETAAVVVPDNIDPALKQQLEDAGANVVEYKAGDNADRLAKVNSVEGAKFQQRDYDAPSDVDLVMQMDEKDADTPEGKALIREAQAKQKQIEALQEKLAEAKRQLSTTKRALNTKGIGNVAGNVIRDFGISDAGGKNIKQQATGILTDAYQKALDQIDRGATAAEAWETVYNGAVEAANLLIDQGRYTENNNGKWTNVPYSQYIGEDRQMVIDQMVSEAAVDFTRNRYRAAIQETAADRLVARTEKRMQSKLDETKAKNAELKAENERLEQDNTFLKDQADGARFAAGNLYDQVKDLRQELKDNRKLTAQERKTVQKKIDGLNRQIEAKKAEAAAWRERANRNASLLKSALESKSRDIQTVKAESQRQVDKAVAEKEAAVRKLEAQIEREQQILAGKLKPPAMQKMLKNARETAAAEMQERKNAQFQRMREGRKASELRNRIKNLSDEMKRRMTRPTDGAYVPASLYGSMTKLADVLDTVLAPNPGTKAETRYRSMMDAIHSLAAEYDGIKNLDDYTYASEFDQEIRDQISELERVLNKDRSWADEITGDGKRVGDLSLPELQQTYDILRQINQTMKNAAKLMNSQKLGSLYDAMRNVADQQAGMRSRNASNAFTRGMRNWRLDTMSTMRAVEKMSGWDRNAALYQLMQGIEQGVVDSDIWMMNYNKRMEALKTGKNELEYRKALSKKLDYGVKDTQDGIPVMMTKLQALQLLMTAEREAANDKLVHLQKGGAEIRDALKVQAGKAAKAASYHIDVTPELIQKIRDSLTDWDRQYMQAVHDYFKTESREMNKILYSLKNRVLETEEAYVPYIVDSNYLETKLDSADAAMNMWVKTPGSTNALKTKASQPVIIDGMDTVMAKHVRESADYIGLALPIRDFSKVYNGMLSQGEGEIALPVKETIYRNWGEKGAKLLTDAVLDVQGSSRAGSYNTFIASALNKLQSGFVKSALLVNPSVTIKQAASYSAAESVLSHRALIAGNRPLFTGQDASHSPSLIAQIFAAPSGSTATRIYNEIDEHTSMHYVRRQGMSYTELANEANRQGWLQRNTGMIGARMEQNAVGHGVRKAGQALNPVQWIQRMDVATTAALWVACKEQAKMDGMEAGTNEYWSHVTELYEQTLRETQPMYDNLHRTNMQKEKTGLMQFLFPFRTVPVQNHGQIAASFDAMLAAKGKGKEAQVEAFKHFGKTVWAQTESAVVFSVMTCLAAGLKRKTKNYRDEDDEISPESILKGILSDAGGVWLSNILPMTGSELWSWGSKAINSLKGVPNGYTFDTFSVGVVDMLNDLSDAMDRFFKASGKVSRGEISFGEFAQAGDKALITVAKIFGIPAQTMKTYAEGLWGDVQDIREGRIPAFNDEAVERTNKVNTNRFMKAWNAKDEAKMGKVLEEMFGNVVRTSDAAQGARNALSTAAKEAYKAGDMDLEEYVAFLQKTEAFTSKGITSRVSTILKDDFIAGKRTAEGTVELLVQYKDYKKNPEQSAWSTVKEWAAKAEHVDEEDYDWNQYDELSAAVAADEGVQDEIQELKDHGYTDSQVNTALKKSIQDAFTAGNYTEEEAIDALVRYGVTYSQNGKTVAFDKDKAWQTVREWAAKAGHEDDEDFSYSLYDNLRSAVAAGKGIEAAMKELTDHGVKEADVNKQINETVLKLYTDGEISEKTAIGLLTKYHKVTENKQTRAQTADEAWASLQKASATAAHADDEDYSYSKYEKIDAALDKNGDISTLVKELTDHGTQQKDITSHVKGYLIDRYVAGKTSESALKNQLSRYCGITKTDEVAGILKDANCEKDCGYGFGEIKNAYGRGDLSEATAKKMLRKYGELTDSGAEHRIGFWDYCRKNPDTSISAQGWDSYYEKTLPNIGGTLSGRGMKQSSFTEYLEKRAQLEITDLDGDGKKDNKEYIVNLIASLNLSSAEKDMLYYYNNYGVRDLWKTPWH